MTESDLSSLFQDFYKDDPMVTFQTDLPQTKAVYGSDRTLVSVRLDERSAQVIAFAATDNLGKGAAGQALQCFNLMRGLPETCGLMLDGVYP